MTNTKFLVDGKLISPQEAAKRSTMDRLLYFAQIKLSHPMLKMAMDTVEQIAIPGSPTNIILLIGPTGVGKTTVGRLIVERMIADAMEQMTQDPCLMPAVMWESPLASEKFSFSQWYRDGSRALGASLANKAVSTQSEDDYVYVISTSTASVTALRSSMIGAANGVRAQLGIVDEGAHILCGAKGESLIARVNALKSLSNMTEMKLALLGSYDLYSLVGVTGQLSRRIEVVHFARYRKGKDAFVEVESRDGKRGRKSQELVFGEFGKRLASYLPLEEPFNVTPYLGDLMDACLGVPGIYKDTLHRALAKALLGGRGRMTETHLERSILTKKQRATILEEILKGEANIGDGLFEFVGFSDLAEDTNEKPAKVAA